LSQSDDTNEIIDGEVSHRAELRQQVIRQYKAQSGPLPSPGTLAEYEKVMPGLANRIVELAEKEQAHRHEMQRSTVVGGISIATRGQRYGLVSVLAVLAVAGVLVALGHETAGAVLAGADLVSVAGVFVYGKHTEKSIAEARHRTSDSE